MIPHDGALTGEGCARGSGGVAAGVGRRPDGWPGALRDVIPGVARRSQERGDGSGAHSWGRGDREVDKPESGARAAGAVEDGWTMRRAYSDLVRIKLD